MDSKKCDCDGCRTVREVFARQWWRGWWWGFTIGTVPMAAEWLFHAVHS